jgi:signal transduction histidine kinase
MLPKIPRLGPQEGAQTPRREAVHALPASQDYMQLLRSASHDLRQPITVIRTYAELLTEASGATLTAEQRTFISEILSAADLTMHLLDETLDLASLESIEGPVRAEKLILADVVSRSVALNMPLAARKQMRLILIEEGSPQPVQVDALQMVKAFNNLIGNAIKYCQPNATIHVRIVRHKRNVVASVQDDGPGIPPGDMETLFTPFQRTRARALSEEPGAGLGLAITKRIVERHGGQIFVESKVGRGTTFLISLPVCAAWPSASESEARRKS